MTTFSREMPKYRIVPTEHGDDMPSIASREMGDANRWPEVVWINGLSWPYITDDPARVGPGVLLTGAFVKVPAPAGVYRDADETGQVFERDCAMVGKQLRDDGSGDFEVVTGTANLSQQLQHRIITPRGQARRHPEYGCLVYRILGRVNGPTANLLAAEYVKSAILSDYRIRSVDLAQATAQEDRVKVTARAETIAGGAIDIISG